MSEPQYTPVGSVSEVESGVLQRKKSWRDRLGKIGGGTAVAGAGAAKFGGTAWALLKGAWFLVHFKTALTMLLSVGLYAVFFGWWYAVGFVLLIFVHEMGHVIVLRLQGVKASAPMFIPFFGAFVKIEGPQRSVAQEASSALAGPIFGALGAAAVYAAAQAGGPHALLFQALAYAGFFLNLFNLFPALPLDGGRVAGALHPAVWIAGMAGAVVYMILWPTPVLLFVLVFGGMETYRRWKDRKAGRTGPYFDLPPTTRWAIGAAYAATAAFCFYGIHLTYIAHLG
ncbi:metalloprotease [Hamadaea tsunoensis]|uniref:metalloprotease n=1 Tax=Hamadaea tsunoensis TaxID=53368 RepID=UPI00041408E7|nr:site-2 protease family protein [Hamadaea tsunoensis]